MKIAPWNVNKVEFLEMEMEESWNQPGLSLCNDCDNEDVGDNAAADDEDDDGTRSG